MDERDIGETARDTHYPGGFQHEKKGKTKNKIKNKTKDHSQMLLNNVVTSHSPSKFLSIDLFLILRMN